MKQPLYFAPEKIGPKQSLTPEGFLLCEEVGLARTGTMIYGPGEVPLKEGPDGIIRVDREAVEVFRPEFIASLNGKPICDDHPPVDVNPDNYEQYAMGVVLNPRRGLAAQDDILFGDLLVTRRSAIEEVRTGKREISVGYDADYVQTGEGRGQQKNMIANHVALVGSGRCGSRCAIGDRKPLKEKKRMTFAELRKRVTDAFTSGNKQELETVLDEVMEEAKAPVHIHVHDNANPGENEKGAGEGTKGKPDPKPNAKDKAKDESAKEKEDEKEKEKEKEKEDEKKDDTKDASGKHRFTDAEIHDRFTSLETKVKDIGDNVKTLLKVHDEKLEKEDEKEKKADKTEKTKDAATIDSSDLEDVFRQTVSLSEIIAPGLDVPQFDAKAPREKTFDSICGLRRTALDLAYHQPETRNALDMVLEGRKVKDLSCSDVRTAFAAVAAMKRRKNNDDVFGTEFGTLLQQPKGKVRSQADLNKRNAEFYKQ